MARVLVVDDEPDIRGLIRLILELEGHEVTEAHHGLAALELIARSVPDVLVTDVMMPMLDGAGLIDRLRDDPATRATPILVVSASPHQVERADVVMRKPFAPADLRRVVRELADGH